MEKIPGSKGRKKAQVQTKHICPICFLTNTGGRSKLINHIIRKHPTQKQPKDLCKKCGRKLKGHKIPINDKCTLVGVDEHGIERIHDYNTHVKAQREFLNKEIKDHWIKQQSLELPCTSFSCTVCEIEGFSSSTGVFKHVERVHGPHQELVCDQCQFGARVFISASALKNHVTKKHEKKQRYVCDECGKSLHNSTLCKMHVMEVHLNSRKIKDPKFNNKNMKLLKQFEEDCKCNIEFKATNNKFKVIHFKLIHLGYKQCEKCKKCAKELEYHECKEKVPYNHVPKFFACLECDVVKGSQSGLDNHTQTVHNPEMLVQCNLCPKFFTRQNLQNHLTVGADMVKPTCNICGKAVSHLKQHIGSVHKVRQFLSFSAINICFFSG